MSKALSKIEESHLNDQEKRYLSTIVLAYQGIAKESLDRFNNLEKELPSLVAERGLRMKERTAWVSLAHDLYNQYETDRKRYDELVLEITDSDDLPSIYQRFQQI